MSLDGVSCIDGITSYADDNGHGTHIAGTIGALDNSIGVVGVAPGARLWSVKVLHSDKRGWWSEIICGLDWVAANSGTIDVVNMNLGCAWLGQFVFRRRRTARRDLPRRGRRRPGGRRRWQRQRSDAASTIPAAYDQVITVSALADSDGNPGGGRYPRHQMDRTIPWHCLATSAPTSTSPPLG